jgi:hypothetical protein
MFAALICLVGAVSAVVLVLLVIVVVGISREVPDAKLSSRAPSLMAGLVRRLLGVGVRRPAPTADRQPDECLAGPQRGR